MAGTMRYRIATTEEQATLRQLLYYAVSVPPGEPRPALDVLDLPELVRYVRDWGRRAGDRGIVAEEDGTVVGGAWLRRWHKSDHGYGFVSEATPELSMAVVPERRGRGIGTELLRRLLAEATTSYSSVSLSVAEYNGARRLYERFGFRAVGSDGDSITMLVRLDSDSPVHGAIGKSG